MKTRLMLLAPVGLLLGAIILLSWTNAFAQGPINTHPSRAVYIDNQWHVIPPLTNLWYVFDLSNERLPVEIILFDGQAKRLAFNVYTPDQIGTGSIGNPIGRGSTPTNSSHLVWKGTFFGGGTFFVEVMNPTTTAQPFLLSIAGAGVVLRAQPPAPTPLPPHTIAAPTPTIDVWQTILFPAIATLRAPIVTPTVTATIAAGPTITPTITPTPQSIVIVIVPATATPVPVAPGTTTEPSPAVNNWFTNAFYVVNGRTYTIPGNAERWFAFDYAGDRSKIEIRIPGGNEKKLQFRLFTQGQIARYTVDGTPIGVGSAPGGSNDLVWAGDFPAGGKYFIQVTNFESASKDYEFIITGSGVTLGR